MRPVVLIALLLSANACHLVGGIEEGQAACEVDGEQNGLEGGIDCGGPCTPCADNESCSLAEDCQSGVCVNGLCIPPSCTDGVKNGLESDVDCGGDAPTNALGCPRCVAGQTCDAPTDCASGVILPDAACAQGRCAPSCCAEDCDESCSTCAGTCGSDGYRDICILDLPGSEFCEPPLQCFPQNGVDGLCL